MSLNANETPYRIICRCVPSPQSNSIVSPSRTSAMEETLRSMVGRDADVPSRTRDNDMAAQNIGARVAGDGADESQARSRIHGRISDAGADTRRRRVDELRENGRAHSAAHERARLDDVDHDAERRSADRQIT